MSTSKFDPPKVVEIYPSNYRDIPKTLRVIADEMEDEVYGDVTRCAVVTFSREGEIETFGLGDSEAMETGFLLQMGIQHLIETVKRYASENGE